MGMYCVLCRISAAQLGRIQADQGRVKSLLTGLGNVKSKPWRRLELGKAWDAIDKGLRGNSTDGPLANVVHGLSGRKIGPMMGYGRARYLSPTQVAAAAAALRTFSERWISGTTLGAYVFGDLAPVSSDDGNPTTIDELLRALRTLVRFYARAVRKGDGMIMAIT
jgi:hypothetical protein